MIWNLPSKAFLYRYLKSYWPPLYNINSSWEMWSSLNAPFSLYWFNAFLAIYTEAFDSTPFCLPAHSFVSAFPFSHAQVWCLCCPLCWSQSYRQEHFRLPFIGTDLNNWVYMEINELLSSDIGDKHRHGQFSAAAAVEMGISYWRNFLETVLSSPWQKQTPKTCICIFHFPHKRLWKF